MRCRSKWAGITLLATPPEARVTENTSKKDSPDRTCSTGCRWWSDSNQAPALVMAFSPSQGRALWAALPRNPTVALAVPWHPSCSSRSVGSTTTAKEASDSHSVSCSTGSSPLSAKAPSSPCSQSRITLRSKFGSCSCGMETSSEGAKTGTGLSGASISAGPIAAASRRRPPAAPGRSRPSCSGRRPTAR